MGLIMEYKTKPIHRVCFGKQNQWIQTSKYLKSMNIICCIFGPKICESEEFNWTFYWVNTNLGWVYLKHARLWNSKYLVHLYLMVW